MGSSGASRFSDYPEKPSKKVSSGGGRGGLAGGSSGQDLCDQALTTMLEDFERSEYFSKYGVTPPIGTPLVIEVKKRVIARAMSGESLGNLPTKYNYLAGCIASGRSYSGQVRSILGGFVARITIDAAPQ